MKSFGQTIHELRTERKLSLEKLAKAIGVTDTAILKWEQGKSEATVSNIVALARFFNVTTDYLLGLEDETGTKTYITNSFNNFSGNGNSFNF